MKKFFSSKFGIALTIIVVAGGITYATTWGNKKWLINKIGDKGGAGPGANGTPAPNLQSMTVSQLQKMLKTLS